MGCTSQWPLPMGAAVPPKTVELISFGPETHPGLGPCPALQSVLDESDFHQDQADLEHLDFKVCVMRAVF